MDDTLSSWFIRSVKIAYEALPRSATESASQNPSNQQDETQGKGWPKENLRKFVLGHPDDRGIGSVVQGHGDAPDVAAMGVSFVISRVELVDGQWLLGTRLSGVQDDASQLWLSRWHEDVSPSFQVSAKCGRGWNYLVWVTASVVGWVKVGQ